MMAAASIIVLLFITVGSFDPTRASHCNQNGNNTSPTCPGAFNPVNNIQITTCKWDESPFDQMNCSSCNEMLPIVRAQLHMTNLLLKKVNGVSSNYTDLFTPQVTQDHRPRDCAEVLAAGFNKSGRYAIYPDDDQDPFFVYCDMTTAGGGWTVFQRRVNGTVDFYLNWLEYKLGFGSLLGEHWLGNEKIHRLTSQKTYRLRVDMEDFEGETRYAEYDQFLVADEDLKYQLILGDYTGTAGDSMTEYHNGMNFTTKDQDNDPHTTHNCAQHFRSAFWFKDCFRANPNGEYLRGARPVWGGIIWNSWKGDSYSLKAIDMKIRPLP